MRRNLFVLAIGLGGLAVLLALGAWQLQRLAWKEALLSGIEARIGAVPVALPPPPVSAAQEYLPVAVEGRFVGRPLRVLISQKLLGAGYRLVQVFETGAGRRLLVDRGVVAADNAATLPGESGPIRVEGNLLWPDEVDGFTPAPDIAGNLWYARDLGAMAEVLEAEPLLVVARSATRDGVTPLPVGTEGIPNDHLQYAITWFSLAAVWLGMTLLWLWRIRRRKGEEAT